MNPQGSIKAAGNHFYVRSFLDDERKKDLYVRSFWILTALLVSAGSAKSIFMYVPFALWELFILDSLLYRPLVGIRGMTLENLDGSESRKWENAPYLKNPLFKKPLI